MENVALPMIYAGISTKKRTDRSADVLESVGLYNEDYKYAQDYKLFVDLINKGIKFQIMPDRLYILNTENNISVNHADEQKFYFEKAKKDL